MTLIYNKNKTFTQHKNSFIVTFLIRNERILLSIEMPSGASKHHHPVSFFLRIAYAVQEN